MFLLILLLFCLFPETILKIQKPICSIYNVIEKVVSMGNIKTYKKHCDTLLKVSNEIKQYAKIRLLNIINDFDKVFPMETTIK